MFCPDPLFDKQLSWNTTNPNLTHCMRETVLVLIPCGILWITSFIWCYQIPVGKKKNDNFEYGHPPVYLSALKCLLSTTLIANTIGEYCWQISKHGYSGIYPSSQASLFVFLASLLLVLYLQIAEYWTGTLASLPSSIFWLLLSFTMLPEFKFKIGELAKEPSWQGFVLLLSLYPCVLTHLLICLLPLCFKQRVKCHGKSPVEEATLFSYLSFSWMNELVYSGYKLPLSQEQLPTIPEDIQTVNCTSKFIRQWKSGKKEDNVTIVVLNELLWQYKWEMLIPLCIGCMSVMIGFINPFILKVLINFSYSKEEMWKGYFFVASLFLSSGIGAVTVNIAWYQFTCVVLKLKTCLMCLVYRKSLKLSNSARNTFSVGDITNFMSVDAQSVAKNFPSAFHAVFYALQIVMTFYFLFWELGIATFAGIVAIFLSLPIMLFISKIIVSAIARLMKEKGVRIKYMNECLLGINVVKLYAWEHPFIKRILKARATEVSLIRRGAVGYAFLLVSFFFTPLLIIISLFSTYILIDSRNILSAEKIFVSLSLLSLLRSALLNFPPKITDIMRMMVSIKRIETFLNASELKVTHFKHGASGKVAIKMSNGCFSWSCERISLKDINLEIPHGSLTAIVGAVGSGKSSLLSAILGDIDKTSGNTSVQGSISYCPQLSWIQNKSLKNNIMFNCPLQKRDELYHKVIEACALAPDLDTFPAGDNTEIGENGINLSGGQKQRVSLARAVFANRDIYLLDDPFSAVDAYVGKHIFDNVISSKTGLLKGKTRVLVTHNLSFLDQVDTIVVLEDGLICEAGTYEELCQKTSSFSKILAKFIRGNSQLDSKADIRPLKKSVQNKVPPLSQAGILVEDELIRIGAIHLSVYIEYIKKLGFLVTLGGRSLSFLACVLSALGAYSLSLWADANHRNLYRSNVETFKYLGMYTAFGVLGVISFFLSCYIYALSFAKASGVIHKDITMQVFKSPLRFFNTTPIGRILNLFSNDINVVDIELPITFANLSNCFFEITVIVMVVCFVTPFSLLVALVLGLIYCGMLSYYMRVYRQLSRLSVVSLSPIFSHFSETLGGTTSIRAYHSEDYFIRISESRIEDHVKCFYYRLSAQKWFFLRIEILGNIFVAFAALFAIQARDTLSPSLLGLSLMYAFLLIDISKLFCNFLVEVESMSISLERLFDFYDNPQESDWVTKEDAQISCNWPSNGTVQFSQYSTRYREGLELALDNIDLDIKSQEKIGICGRTGSGKSTLALALLRILEPAKGAIFIDGVDISQLGLNLLRSRLTVIPQDPILFSGTVRFNLDPFDKYSDGKLWMALDHANLAPHIKSLDSGLDSEVSEGGENFSVGQRQLICLARALLRKTKVLILDEATAAVDVKTDDLIQATIRKEFDHCTIIIIAHRLNTVEDCDRIAILGEGRISELGSPKRLLEDKTSALSQLKKAQH